jgi:hypothetical protein
MSSPERIDETRAFVELEREMARAKRLNQLLDRGSRISALRRGQVRMPPNYERVVSVPEEAT